MNNSKRCIFPSIGWKYPGMALPLVILLVLVGFVFVGVGAYVVKNLFWSSQGVVIESKLYNAAQSGIEWGMRVLKEANDNNTLKVDSRSLTNNLLDIAALSTSNDPLAYEQTVSGLADNNITVKVSILNCDYTFSPPLSSALQSLVPPQAMGSAGTGGGGSTSGEGTSAIIDPNKSPSFGGGGVTEHSFVIRSRAEAWNRSKEIETMVVIAR